MNVLPALGAAFAALICVIAGTFLANREAIQQTKGTLMCIVLTGLLFTGAQTLAVYEELSVEWFEPVHSILQTLRLVSFDLKVVKMGCIVGNNVVLNFLCRQLVAPMAVPVILLVISAKKYMDPMVQVLPELLNTVGVVYNVFFISIIFSGLAPFVREDHPGGNGWSMKSQPSILWLEDEAHVWLMVLGVIALLVVPLPFMAGCLYSTVMYPSWLGQSSRAGMRRLRAVRFLFARFAPERYYYMVILMTRSLLVCMVPIVANGRGNAALQVCLMCGILSGFLLLQQRLNPWRDDVANLIDGVMCHFLLLLLVFCSMAMDLSDNFDQVQAVGTAAFALFAASGILPLVAAVYFLCRPLRQYDMFICHHKADAAAGARFLKMLFQGQGKRVFIDSDDLKELDTLFDIVKTSVSCLVVYLTRDTLTRPWCAGEIATAFKSGKVKVLAVKHPSFVAPSEETLANIRSYLDAGGGILEEFGLSLQYVCKAFRKLTSTETPTVTFRPSAVGVQRFHNLIEDLNLVASGKSPAKDEPVQSQLSKAFGTVVVSVGHTDEAIASAGILVHKIKAKVLGFVPQGINCIDSEIQDDIHSLYGLVANSRAVVLILTRDTLDSLPQLKTIAHAMKAAEEHRGWPAVIPVCTPGFLFPNDTFYSEMLPCIWRRHTIPGSGSEDVADAEIRIQAFFRLIAITFSTHSSERVLDAQAEDIVARIPVKSKARHEHLGEDADVVHPVDQDPLEEGLPSYELGVNSQGISRVTTKRASELSEVQQI